MNKLFISFILICTMFFGICAYATNRQITKDISHTSFKYNGNHINVFLINKKDCATPVLSNSVLIKSSKSIKAFSKANPNYIVMVNGTYFSMKTGVPLGLLVINKEMITGDVFNRASIGIWEDKYDINRVKCNIKVNNIQLDNINQPRMLSTHAIMYNNRWGTLAPKTPKYGVQVQIQDNVITGISANQLQIPKNGYVIVGPASKLNKLKLKDKVNIQIGTTPDWSTAKHIISGGPILVKNGNIYVDTKEERLQPINGRYNRTAIGYTRANNLVILTADGTGLTLNETAKLMQSFGCYNAMNLDGGGSTSLYVRGIGNLISKQARYLSNVIIVK